MSACLDAPDDTEKVQVLRRAMRRIDRDLLIHHRTRSSAFLDREKDVLESIADEIIERCRS